MKKVILSLAVFSILLAAPSLVLANELNNFMINMPILNNADLVGIIFKTIQYVLSFLGVIAVVVIIIGGFMWMTAAGNEEKVGKAKKVLVQGLIGLIIVLLAFAIATFVINQLRAFA